MSKSKFGKYGDFTNLRDYILDVYTEPTPGTPYAYNYSNSSNSSNFSSNNSQLNGVPGLTSLVTGVTGLVTGMTGLSDFPSIQELNELREELNELRSGISILSKEYYFFQKNEWFGDRKIIKDYNYENINKCESVSGKVDENFKEILRFLIAQYIKRNNPISIFNYSYVPERFFSTPEEINNPPMDKKFKLYFPTKIFALNLNETEKIIEKTMEVAPQHMPAYPYYRIIVTTNINNGTITFSDIAINTINKDVEIVEENIGIVEQNGGNREYYGTYRYIFELSYLDV